MADGHVYIGIELPRPVQSALEGVQRNLRERLRGAEVRLVPVRALTLPLDDAGVCSGEALEAIELAVERAAAAHGPFSIRLGGVAAAPSDEAPDIVRVMVHDEHGHLGALRATLHRHLDRYGFPVPAAPWRPHLPIARLGANAPPLPALPEAEMGTVRVRRLVVWRRPAGDARATRFLPVAARDLATAQQSAQAAAADEAALVAEITAQLDARLAAREETSAPVRTPRRRRGRAAR